MPRPDVGGGARPGEAARSLQLDQLADAFGDPTRRVIYLHLRNRGKALTAAEVARAFGLHRTAARAQLERLRGLGLVVARTGDGISPGRPMKKYEAVDERLEFTLPGRRYGQLAQMLLELLSMTTPAELLQERAAALGREEGERLAAELVGEGIEPPVALTPEALVDWMKRSGYDARILPAEGVRGGETAIEVRNCPYAELSRRHQDTVCAFDGGMFLGMLGVPGSGHRQTSSLSSGDTRCIHLFRLWPVEGPAAGNGIPAQR